MKAKSSKIHHRRFTRSRLDTRCNLQPPLGRISTSQHKLEQYQTHHPLLLKPRASTSYAADMQLITILLSALFAMTAFAQWGHHHSEGPHSWPTASFPHSIPHYSWKREVEHEMKTEHHHHHSITKTKWHHPTPTAYPTYGAKQIRDEDILERARPIPKVLMA